MSPTLFVVPTPLGNLEDITLRAIRVLKEVDLIAAEDTRHSRVLLDRYDIHTQTVSYHQHTKLSRIPYLLDRLKSSDVALISDAGTPSLSDPGFELIAAAVKAGIKVEVLPGPSAITTAVGLSALPARGFLSLGFLPRKKKDLTESLSPLKDLPFALVIFESPRRVVATLERLEEILGNREAMAAKELTKVHQTAFRGTLSEIRSQVELINARGEWTLVVGPGEPSRSSVPENDIVHLLDRLTTAGVSSATSVRLVSEILDVPRSRVYEMTLRNRNAQRSRSRRPTS